MAVEIADLIHSMVSFTAANPPVILSRSGAVLAVSRVTTGQYTVEFAADQKLPLTGAALAGYQMQATSKLVGAATFCDATEDGTGDLLVQERALAGTLADNGARIDIVVYKYPTVS